MMIRVAWAVLALTCLAHTSASRERCQVMTAYSHSDVSLVSDHIANPSNESITNFFVYGGSDGLSNITQFIVDFESAFVAAKNDSNTSVIVQFIGGDSENVEMIVTLILPDVSETDSGYYRLESVHATLSCWTLYVLGEANYTHGHGYVEEGLDFIVTDFPHLSEKVAGTMNVTTKWQAEIEHGLFEEIENFQVASPRRHNNKQLVYTIEGQNGTEASVNYTLTVSYAQPMVIEPNVTQYALSENGTFRCIPECNPACDVWWELNDNNISDSSVLGPELRDRPGLYICHATNAYVEEIVSRSILVTGQGCSHKKHQIITTTTHENIALLSGAYDIIHNNAIFYLTRTGKQGNLAFFIVNETDALDVISHAPNVSVKAEIEGHRRIGKIIATLKDVTEADSGLYSLAVSHDDVLGCWTVYVLGYTGSRFVSNGYVEEGTVLNEFPHLSDDVVHRMNASTSWQLDGERLNERNDDQLTVDRSMNNKRLAYMIEGPINDAISVNYTLNVSYTGPVILEPNKTRYAPSENGTVRCVAECNPACNVTWKRGETVVSKTDILDQESRGLLGEYTCHVTNTATGMHMNASLAVTCGGSVTAFLEPNKTMYVLTPGDILPDIRCVAECNSPCNTTWQKQGVSVSDTAVLSAASLPRVKSGVYTCLVQDVATMATTAAHVVLYYEDDVTVFLEPNKTMYVLTPGDILPDIRCVAECNSPCNTTWQKQGVSVSDTAVLSAASLPRVQSGVYTCLVQHVATMATTAAHVVLYYEESITVSLEPNKTMYVLTPGESLPDIRCVAECNSPCNTTWQKQGVSVSDTAVLSAASLPRVKSGVYTCLVQHVATMATTAAQVFVYYEESITVSLEPNKTMYVLTPGESLPDIRCVAECNSPCNTTWQKQGVSVSDTAVLSAASLPRVQSGVYTCLVQHVATMATTAAHVVIYYEDMITASLEPSQTMYILEPDETIPPIRCIAECTSHCNVSWRKLNVLVSATDVLTTVSLPSDKGGVYTCHVQASATNTQMATHVFIYVKEKKSRTAVYVLAGFVAMFVLARLALLVREYQQGTCTWPRHVFTLRKQQKRTMDIGMYNNAMNTDIDTERTTEVHQPDIQRQRASENVYDTLNYETDQGTKDAKAVPAQILLKGTKQVTQPESDHLE